MSQNQNVPATRQPSRSLVELLTSQKANEQIIQALPNYYTPEKFVSVVRTALNKNPKLAQCTPESFMVAMITAAQSGMLPDGRYGHLIPRYNKDKKVMEATFQPDYKGKVNLIRKNDRVTDVYAEVVRKEDKFAIKLGLHRDLVHEPDFTKARGPIVGAYAVIAYNDDTYSWCFMSREEVEGIRERSESWKTHKEKGWSSPWVTDEGEMFKKTALNRLAKLADLDPDTLDRFDADPELRIVHDVEAEQLETTPRPRALLPTKPKAAPAQAAEPDPADQAAIDADGEGDDLEPTEVEQLAPAKQSVPSGAEEAKQASGVPAASLVSDDATPFD